MNHGESPTGPLVWGTTVHSDGGTHKVIHRVPQFRLSLSGQQWSRKRLLKVRSCCMNSCRNTMQRSKCTRLDPWFYHVLSARTPWSLFLRYYLPHMYSLLYRWGQRYWSAGIAHWIIFELEEFPSGKESLTNLALLFFSLWRWNVLLLQSNKSHERRPKINQRLNLLLA